jgi:hypothetical protein
MGIHSKNSFQALCLYFIIYATAQGIMDAYEEAIEQPFLSEFGVNIEMQVELLADAPPAPARPPAPNPWRNLLGLPPLPSTGWG